MLVQKTSQGCAFEIRNDRHADASCATSSSLDSNQDQRRLPTLELTAAAQSCLCASHPGFVNFFFAPERFPCHVDHGSPEFVEHHPRSLIPRQAKLVLQQECRNTALVGSHQVGSPEPSRQRSFRALKNCH